MPSGELSIYEIVFEDLPGVGASEHVPNMSGSLPATASLGRVVLTPIVEVDPEVQSNHQEQQEEPEGSHTIQVSERLQALASSVLDNVLSSGAALVEHGLLELTAFNRTRVSLALREVFEEALKRDGRIEYFKDGMYLVVEHAHAVEESYLAGIDLSVEQSSVPCMVRAVLDAIRPNKGNVSYKSVLKTLGSLGTLLTESELSEFMYLFATNPAVIPLPDGSFNIRRLENAIKANKSENKASDVPLLLEVSAQNEHPLSRSQITKALKSINASDEYKTYNDKRRANPRRRRPKKRTYGSNHGRKKSIDDLIKEMNAREV